MPPTRTRIQLAGVQGQLRGVGRVVRGSWLLRFLEVHLHFSPWHGMSYDPHFYSDSPWVTELLCRDAYLSNTQNSIQVGKLDTVVGSGHGCAGFCMRRARCTVLIPRTIGRGVVCSHCLLYINELELQIC